MRSLRAVNIYCALVFMTSLLLAQSGPATSGVAPDPMPAKASDGGPARGKEVFEKRCTGCHALGQNREGPMLRGVYGRTSGSVANFTYSPALKAARIVWNDASIERWLADPDLFVPGNNMGFRVAKPQERQDLVRFLKETSLAGTCAP
jgi:cytochrome c2